MADFIFDDGAAAGTAVPVVTGTPRIDAMLAARDNYAAILADISLNPKPSYSVHGHAYSWAEYQQMLIAQIDNLDKLLGRAEPFEIVSQGIL